MILRKKYYLGSDSYPSIIDKETFDKAEELRIARAGSIGRIRELEKQEKVKPMVQSKYTDSFEQVKYEYGLIQSEVQKMNKSVTVIPARSRIGNTVQRNNVLPCKYRQ